MGDTTVKSANTDKLTIGLEGGYESITVTNGQEGDNVGNGASVGLGAGWQGSFAPEKAPRLKFSVQVTAEGNFATNPIAAEEVANGPVVTDDNGECHDFAGTGACSEPEADHSAAANGASLSEANFNNYTVGLRLGAGYEFSKYFSVYAGPEFHARLFTDNATVPMTMVNSDGEVYGEYVGSQSLRATHPYLSSGAYIQGQVRVSDAFVLAPTGGVNWGSTEFLVSDAADDGEAHWEDSPTFNGYVGAQLMFMPMGDIGDVNLFQAIGNAFKGDGEKKPKKAKGEKAEAADAARTEMDYSGIPPQQEFDMKATELATSYGLSLQDLLAKCHITKVEHTESDGFMATYDNGSMNRLGTTADNAVDAIVAALKDCEDCRAVPTDEEDAADTAKKSPKEKRAERKAARDAEKAGTADGAEEKEKKGFHPFAFLKKDKKADE